MRPDLSGIDFRVKMLVSVSFSGYITFKDYWRHCSYIHCFVGAFESLSSYVQTTQHCRSNIVGQRSQHCVRKVAWKSPLRVGFLTWTMLLERKNLRKTVFLDLRYFGFVEEEIKIWINGLTHGENFRSCDHSDHMETWLFRVRGDDDRWDRTTLSYSLTCKIPTLSSI